MKNIYFLGNEDVEIDNQATNVLKHLKPINDTIYVHIKPNDDIPSEDFLIIVDTVVGIDKIVQITEENLSQFTLPPRTSAHDYDLGFQLRYLHKIGKVKHFTIIGIPPSSSPDYDLIHSILRKLVAHDIQGS